MRCPPPPALSRRAITEPLGTGVRALDALLPLGLGQRVGLFAGTGVGKSTLLGMLCRHASADVIVVGLIGERGREVGEALSAAGIRSFFRSQLTAGTQLAADSLDCLVVNTTGELRYFYERADVVFVGKSLTADGGQNPIEPAALGKAVVFGPNMQNFPQIAPEFVKRNAAVQVRDAAELERLLGELLTDSARREALGRNALQVVRENQGSIERTVEMILEQLPGGRR